MPIPEQPAPTIFYVGIRPKDMSEFDFSEAMIDCWNRMRNKVPKQTPLYGVVITLKSVNELEPKLNCAIFTVISLSSFTTFWKVSRCVKGYGILFEKAISQYQFLETLGPP
jgi:hypothetical protein